MEQWRNRIEDDDKKWKSSEKKKRKKKQRQKKRIRSRTTRSATERNLHLLLFSYSPMCTSLTRNDGSNFLTGDSGAWASNSSYSNNNHNAMRNAEKPQNKSGNIASLQRYILLCSFCLNHFRVWLWDVNASALTLLIVLQKRWIDDFTISLKVDFLKSGRIWISLQQLCALSTASKINVTRTKWRENNSNRYNKRIKPVKKRIIVVSQPKRSTAKEEEEANTSINETKIKTEKKRNKEKKFLDFIER